MSSIFQQYLHQKVKVIIDRPMSSKHPRWRFSYPVNYIRLKQAGFLNFGLDKKINKR